ncbi:hypothetical protein [Nocardioides taihuensis]|uniref:EthD domain-containing protein n=1 Tax=Nocardioides taihuensis TaxID=1835606 RepID=A0ABW0BMR2_9ACTN
MTAPAKVVALVADEAPARWLDASVHDALAEAGVVRLQVNVADEAVAGVLRLQHLPVELTAVLSAWADPEAVPAVVGVLDTLGAPWTYLVDERRPLDPPESWDGSRAAALANVAVLRRPDSLDRDEWLRRWLGPHTQVAIDTQATFGYLQNVVLRPLSATAPVVDAVVEELFPVEAVTDTHAFYGSGGDDAELTRRMARLMESVATIGADRDLDLVPTSRYLFDLSR